MTGDGDVSATRPAVPVDSVATTVRGRERRTVVPVKNDDLLSVMMKVMAVRRKKCTEI